MKKYISRIFIFIFVIYTLASYKPFIAKAYQWPNEGNTGNDPNYYTWEGKFYWFDGDDINWYANPKRPATLYGNNWDDIQLDGARENDGYDEFGFYATNAWWTEGNSADPHWNYRYGRYEKRVEATYRRDKTTPELNSIELNRISPKKEYIEENYDTGDIHWEKPNQDIYVEVSSKQSWPGSRNVRLKDYVQINGLKIEDQNNNTATIKTNRNNYNIANIPSNSVGISSINSVQSNGGYNTEIETNIYNVNFKEDGYDYKLSQYALSENGKETNWGNSHTVKTDGKGPIWDGNPIIKNQDEDKKILPPDKAIDGIKVEINNVRDIRGEKNNLKPGVGLKFNDNDNNAEAKGQYIIINKIDDNGKNKDQGIIISDYYNMGEDDKNSFEFEVNFNDDRYDDYFQNDCKKMTIKFVSFDLLDNKSESQPITIEKIDPTPRIPGLKVSKYDYHEENSNNYWIKCGSTFAVYTDAYIPNEYGMYPTETSLLMLENDDDENYRYIEHKMDITSSSFSYNPSTDDEEDNFIKETYDIDNSKLIFEQLKNFPSDNAIQKKMSLEEEKNMFYSTPKIGIKTEPKLNYLAGIHWLKTDEQVDYVGLKMAINKATSEVKEAEKNFEYDKSILDDANSHCKDVEEKGEDSIYDEESVQYEHEVADANCLEAENELDLAESNKRIAEDNYDVETDSGKKLPQDGRSYKLYSKATYNYERFIYSDGEDFETQYSAQNDSNIWLNFDGTPPTGDTTMSLDGTNLKIKVGNIKDYCAGSKTKKEGSGIKEIYVKFFSINDYGEAELLNYNGEIVKDDRMNVQYQLDNNDIEKIWTTNIDISKFSNYNKLKVKVFTKDNVGNIGEIEENTYSLLNLDGSIVPYRDRDENIEVKGDSEIPILEEGEEGRLTINTTASVTRLIGTFPPKFKEYANKVNEEFKDVNKMIFDESGISVPFEYTDKEDFKVPLYVPNKIYFVKVQAVKGDKTKQIVLKLKVTNSALDRVRTRLR